MQTCSDVVMNLPNDQEIERTSEVLLREDPPLIQRQIRYKNGMRLELYSDRSGRIFKINVDSGQLRLLLLNNLIIRVQR